MKKFARRDINHSSIVEYFRARGYFVHDIAELKNCSDLIVTGYGKTFYVEIKNGDNVPSKKKLTDGELIFKKNIEAHGGKYFIVESKTDVDNLIRDL